MSCCKWLDLIAERCSGGARPVGITHEQLFSVKSGEPSRRAVVLHIPKAKRGAPDELGGATYVILNHCPLCGTDLNAATGAIPSEQAVES